MLMPPEYTLEVMKLSETSGKYSHRYREGLLSAISAGFFLILAGILFVTTPNVIEKVTDFFQNLTTVQVPHMAIYLPAPADPRAYLAIYSMVEQFAMIWGTFLVAILIARLVVYSPTRKRAQNLGDIVFWFGTTYLIQTLLLDTTKWFEFWSAIVMLAGVSLITRAIFLAVVRTSHT